jgi:hypothetical protein
LVGDGSFLRSYMPKSCVVVSSGGLDEIPIGTVDAPFQARPHV